MKIVAKSLFVVGFVLCVGTRFSVTGQALLNPISKYEARVQAGERHVYLEPQQELETVEVSEGCITFLTEVRFRIDLPFGKTVESVLPAGSRWSIPSGKYKLNNPTKAPIEYVLKVGSTCGDISRN